MLSSIATSMLPAAFDAVPSNPLAQAFVGLALLALVTIVGRFLLSLAWKLLLIATVVIGVLYGLTLIGI